MTAALVKIAPIELPAQFRAVELEIEVGLSLAEWQRMGDTLLQMDASIQWWAGDWLVYGEKYLSDTYSQGIQEKFKKKYQTLANYAYVARAFDVSRRRETIPWSHYEAVAGIKDKKEQDRLLGLIEELDWTVAETRENARQSKAKAAFPDAKVLPPVVLTDGPELCIADATELPYEDGTIDLIFTSPPYCLNMDYEFQEYDYHEYLEKAADWCAEMYRVLKGQGRCVVNVALDTTLGESPKPLYADWVRRLEQAGFAYRTTILWDEGNVTHAQARGSVYSPSAPHVFAPTEALIVCHKGEWSLGRKGDSEFDTAKGREEWVDWLGGHGVWRFSNGGRNQTDHPAEFSPELVRRVVQTFSFRGDVFLDPFMGSGVGPYVAHTMGREAHGTDRSAEYVATATRWIAGALS